VRFLLSTSDGTLGCLLDELGGTFGPARDVRAVVASVNTDRVADDEGHRFNLDLGHLAVRDRSLRVEQRVAELVDQCLDRLRRRDIGTHCDLLLEEIAAAVFTASFMTGPSKPIELA
jgi:hypothetical protein